MNHGNQRAAIDAYMTSSVENAPGIKIVRMLYEGGIRFLDRAIACGPDDPQFGVWVSRSDTIVLELRLALRSEHAPEVSASLEELYYFCESRLASAIKNRSVENVKEARDVMQTLLEAWKHVELEGGQVGA